MSDEQIKENKFPNDGIIHVVHLHMPMNNKRSIQCSVLSTIQEQKNTYFVLFGVTDDTKVHKWICFHSKPTFCSLRLTWELQHDKKLTQ